MLIHNAICILLQSKVSCIFGIVLEFTLLDLIDQMIMNYKKLYFKIYSSKNIYIYFKNSLNKNKRNDADKKLTEACCCAANFALSEERSSATLNH